VLLRLTGAPVARARRTHNARDGQPQVEPPPRSRIRIVDPLPVLEHRGVDVVTVVLPPVPRDGRAGHAQVIHAPPARHDPAQEFPVPPVGLDEDVEVPDPLVKGVARFALGLPGRPHLRHELPLGQGVHEDVIVEQGLHRLERYPVRRGGHPPIQPCRELAEIPGEVPVRDRGIPVPGVGLPCMDARRKRQQQKREGEPLHRSSCARTCSHAAPSSVPVHLIHQQVRAGRAERQEPWRSCSPARSGWSHMIASRCTSRRRLP
jgi:hypothetical protein